MTNCFQCKHFIITWDKQLPRGCKVHGFKSKELPSRIVFQSSGMECQFFKNKKEKKKPIYYTSLFDRYI